MWVILGAFFGAYIQSKFTAHPNQVTEIFGAGIGALVGLSITIDSAADKIAKAVGEIRVSSPKP